MTDKVMEMARRICARVTEGDSDNPLRVAKANRYLSGELDGDHHIQIAAAAIREAQRLDAEVADERAAMYRRKASRHDPLGDDIFTAHENLINDAEACDHVATAIRTGDQYGEAKP